MEVFCWLSLISLVIPAYPVYVLWSDYRDRMRKEEDRKKEEKRKKDLKQGDKLSSEIHEVLVFLGEAHDRIYYNEYTGYIEGYVLDSGLFNTYRQLQVKLDKADQYLLELRARAYFKAKQELNELTLMAAEKQDQALSSKKTRRAAK